MFDPRHFRNDYIELGSGQFGADQWSLMYDPVGIDPPDDDHLPSGPVVRLYIGRAVLRRRETESYGPLVRERARGGGGPIKPLSGSLGRSGLLVRDLHSTAHAFGQVAFGFDRVRLDCAKGPTVDAVVVDCANHPSFNYYVGEVASRVVRVRATGPDGRTAALEQDQ